MASCEHCGTEYASKTEADRYCCRGCEFVAELISENGFERFYDLKQGIAVAPVRSRPFEEHDFSWLTAKVLQAEADAEKLGDAARLDLALEGISCVACVWLIEAVFLRHAGALRVEIEAQSGVMRVFWLAGEF
ncbi:MAG: heavy metal translocating P-type ATPase metal-binding domain-containing protein, partial [Luteolibacter sp.]